MLKGAAGPNPDPKGSDSEPDSEVELLPISTVPEVSAHQRFLFPVLTVQVPRPSSHTIRIHRRSKHKTFFPRTRH